VVNAIGLTILCVAKIYFGFGALLEFHCNTLGF
jgi:hypothetical protein